MLILSLVCNMYDVYILFSDIEYCLCLRMIVAFYLSLKVIIHILLVQCISSANTVVSLILVVPVFSTGCRGYIFFFPIFLFFKYNFDLPGPQNSNGIIFIHVKYIATHSIFHKSISLHLPCHRTEDTKDICNNCV